MKVFQLTRPFIILSGSVFILIMFYASYPMSHPQILQQQIDDTKKDDRLHEDNPKLKNILDTIKRYLQEQAPISKILQDNSSEADPDDVHDLSPDDIFDLSPADWRPPPSMIPVTTNTEECLPQMKDLRVQPVNEQDCDQPYVLMNHGGRLGNKLCQYASLYLLRHLYGVRVAITKYMQSNLRGVMKDISLPAHEAGCFPSNTTNLRYDAMYMKLYTAAKEARLGTTNKNLITTPLLNQSYYVFNNPGPRALLMDHRDLLRSILRFKDEVISKAIGNIDKAIKPYNATYYRRDFPIVTVHVRRSDYTGYIRGKFNLTQLDEVYFKRAFDFYKKRLNGPMFLVLSDDLAWCRMNLATQDVVVMDGATATVDMATISLGDHHITSYGTYSFTGALLGHGHITHPIGHNRRYKLVDCVRSPYFHYISRDKTYVIDNSHVKLV
ncbi:galactoside alpha-(1,2)-fucosyltransferase 1-like [Eriocheir sinensis]|uniref:galactoside alpha-(1,2)-fucosyltransferase 1-like n=1 Tax=Eriocheir sinensis TaxID=95602 RepID=UPI0021CA6012|nr:galactoside alpha-(1,2)-fucosyltransferase 1-like [Eriocheir sinensis]